MPLLGSMGAGSARSFGRLAGLLRASINYTFSSSTTDAALNVSSIAGYVAGKSDITITINSGVFLYSTTTSGYGLNLSGGTTGDTITIVNNGFIMGKGGDGGHYGDASYVATPGGPALNLGVGTSSVTINTLSGYIGGGGGGGGNAGLTTTGAAGGGGAGGGNGGNYSLGTIVGLGGTIGNYGGAGAQSTDGNFAGGGGGSRTILSYTQVAGGVNGFGGLGGDGGGSGGSVYSYNESTDFSGSGGSGGNPGGNAIQTSGGKGKGGGGGGGWGASGGNGAVDPGLSSTFVGTGAAGGKAVNLNGKSVTWTGGFNSSRVLGAVS